MIASGQGDLFAFPSAVMEYDTNHLARPTLLDNEAVQISDPISFTFDDEFAG